MITCNVLWRNKNSFIQITGTGYSEHSSHIVNEASSTVGNMNRAKYNTMIYTFSRNRSDQFSSSFFQKLAGLGRT